MRNCPRLLFVLFALLLACGPPTPTKELPAKSEAAPIAASESVTEDVVGPEKQEPAVQTGPMASHAELVERRGQEYSHAEMQLEGLERDVMAYHTQYGEYPRRAEDLVETPDGFKLIFEAPKDPWGERWTMKRSGEGATITSAGPDSIPQDADDISLSIPGGQPQYVRMEPKLSEQKSLAELDLHDSIKLTTLQLQNLNVAVMAYRLQYGHYPQRLEDLINTPDGFKLIEEVPKDMWEQELALQQSGSSVTISSAGPDRAHNTEDDISTTMTVE